MKKNELIQLIEKELHSLDDLIAELEERRQEPSPKGHLRIVKGPAGLQFFLITKKGDTNGRYLKKTEYPLAVQLLQAEYDQKLLQSARKWQKALAGCLTLLPECDLCDVGTRSPTRRALITPRIPTDEEAVENWKHQPWTQCDYRPEEKIYRTRNGELVRSKSEKIIADLLEEYDIPYRYENEVLIDGVALYPDFTLYDVASRREVILEHLGLMDDESYASKNLRKIARYVKAGYKQGITLLISAETKNAPLDVEYLECILKPYARNHKENPGNPRLLSNK